MWNISSLLTSTSVKQLHVLYFFNLEYAQYSKSPEKKVQKDPEPEPVDLGRVWHSRLRLYLWAQLRYLYELYVATKVLPIND